MRKLRVGGGQLEPDSFPTWTCATELSEQLDLDSETVSTEFSQTIGVQPFQTVVEDVRLLVEQHLGSRRSVNLSPFTAP